MGIFAVSLSQSKNLSPNLAVEDTKEATLDVESLRKNETIIKYVDAISNLAGRNLKEFEVLEVKKFGTNYLDNCYISSDQLLIDYKKMMSSLNITENCSGEWVGAPGFMSLCETTGTVEGLPGACSFLCMDPYTAQDCILYFPCNYQ